MGLDQLAFWAAFLKIIWINILLSGDNAMVIALACRALPARQRFWGMVMGAGAAAILRIVFTIAIAALMGLPYLKIVGGCALLWIAVKLLLPGGMPAGGHAEPMQDLAAAVRIIVVADLVMSLDNALAVAAAAEGSYVLLGFGLATSIPLVIAGSALFMALLDRFPALVWIGGALLGSIAGEMLATDPAVASHLISLGGWSAANVRIVAEVAGAALVVIVVALGRRTRSGT